MNLIKLIIIPITILVIFSNCLTYTFGWTGGKIDDNTKPKYYSHCRNNEKFSRRNYSIQRNAIRIGFISDLGVAIYFANTINIAISLLYGTLSLFAAGFASIGINHAPVKRSKVEGWSDNNCSSNGPLYIKSYNLNYLSFSKDDIELQYSKCYDHIKYRVEHEFFKNLIEESIDRKLSSSEFKLYMDELKKENYTDFKINILKCTDNKDIFGNNKTNEILCGCDFSTNINGGKFTIQSIYIE